MLLRHRSVIALLAGAAFWAAPPALDQALAETAESMPDSLIVRYHSHANARGRAGLHARMGAAPVRSFDIIPAELVRVAPGSNRDAVAAAYAAQPDVAYVQPNYIYRAIAAPNDSKFKRQWALSNNGSRGGVAGADIDAVTAWDLTVGDDDVIVGVIDTGIDYTHPDLRDNMWTNEAERTGLASVDDDGNGIVDDIFGASFLTAFGFGVDGDPFDDHFHGTHVAGIIGARGNNGLGIAGVNHRVRLMALKFLNADGFGATSDAVLAVEYAVAHDAHLTNNSWGGGGVDQALREAIEAAGAAGQLFVAAAGNRSQDHDLQPSYPSSYPSPNVIAVASTTRLDERSEFSDYGLTTVHLAAPGSDVMSTIPGGYHALSGTSMASPHVAGVAALLLASAPGARLAEVKQWIFDGADSLPALTGLVAGGRRLNARGALLQARPRAGRVSFERAPVGCAGPLALRVRDVDLAGAGSVTVMVASTSGDGETVQLIETATASVFEAELPTRTDGVVAADGLLAVSHDDVATATYADADDGDGPAQSTATATLDCVPAQISNVHVSAVSGLSATVEFDTDESAVGRVRYGTDCAALTGVARSDDAQTAQVVELSNLASETHYYFVTEAIDAAGTVSTDDNNGACYEFTTLFLQDYFTQIFGVDLNEPASMDGQSITFTPDASPHGYTVCREPVSALPVDPTGSTPVHGIGVDLPETTEVVVQGGHQVWLYGQPYDRLHMNWNGSITFVSPDIETRVRPESHFTQPRISVAAQMNPIYRGWATAKQLADRIVVTYLNKRDYGDRQQNQAQAELFFDGRIRLTTLSLSTEAAQMLGLSEGGGLPADFVESDLASSPRCGAPATAAVPLAGRKLKLMYDALERESQLKVIVQDPAFVLPVQGSAADPTVNGASLVILNPMTGERDTQFLPEVYWQPTATGYAYQDLRDTGRSLLQGRHQVAPCSKVMLEAGRFRATCEGEPYRHGFTFDLDEHEGQTEVALLLTLGAGPDVSRYCSVFGGRVVRDRAATRVSKGQFYATKAPAPAQCPALP